MNEILKIKNLSKNFGKKQVLNGINLQLKNSEILTILGESGCGKSTLLRIIAGLESKDGGEISLLQNYGVAMMFQNYALFPHLNVRENIEFALHKMGKNERKARVDELLEKFKIAEISKNSCDKISGGQAQRVAFARAVANKERLLLLDEPFANLDHNLRSALRSELKQMIKESEISAIMVTHDKEDAFVLSDSIALIKSGEILAIDTPKNLYLNPSSLEVGRFLGDMNFIDHGSLDGLDDRFMAWLKNKNFMFRPEQILSGGKYKAQVLSSTFFGSFYELDLKFHKLSFKAKISSNIKIDDIFEFDLA
ncbi:ABC transporter ATP-binding protein [Campylobacter suis]|uniref:Vitamin B12 import ATP-binding protein BtuD n=1 Tax=Campylobacter suis TaxID=2790657 RepID=A0ABM8Q570_9BACT|nr:ABC transporter ATP-binding protein [Campylobacter suis]CAD7288015.1 Vitamin B12 import ATP-binding protein BtuD [Campylobacter suis]